MSLIGGLCEEAIRQAGRHMLERSTAQVNATAGVHVQADSSEVLAFENVRKLVFLQLTVLEELDKAAIADLKLDFFLFGAVNWAFELAAVGLIRAHEWRLLCEEVQVHTNHVTASYSVRGERTYCKPD